MRGRRGPTRPDLRRLWRRTLAAVAPVGALNPAVQVALDSLRSFQPFGAILGSLFRYALFGFADFLAPSLAFTAIGADIEFDGVPRVRGEICQFAANLIDGALHPGHSPFRSLFRLFRPLFRLFRSLLRLFRFLFELFRSLLSFLMGFDYPAKLILKRAEHLLVVVTQ